MRLLQVLGYAGDSGQVDRRSGITGVERVVQLLLQGLDPGRFEHYLAYPEAGELQAVYRERARAVLPIEPRRRLDRDYVRALAGFVHQHGIDLVVSHGLRFDFLSQLACRRTRVPHLVVRAVALADETMSLPRRLAYGIVDAWTLRACDGIVAVSEASKRRMQGTQRLSERRIHVIPNGVRLPVVSDAERRAARQTLGVAEDELLVGGVGQLIARKSFATLVAALATIAPQHPRLAGVVLGEGPERARLHSLARQQGVRLLLPGYVPEPAALVANFDVSVLPSRAEGMPLVVLESMALGIPTVATPAAGTVELIEDGASGFLFPIGDASALAAILDRLLRDPELRRRAGTAAAARVRNHYSLDAMLQRFSEHLLRIAAAGAAAHEGGARVDPAAFA